MILCNECINFLLYIELRSKRFLRGIFVVFSYNLSNRTTNLRARVDGNKHRVPRAAITCTPNLCLMTWSVHYFTYNLLSFTALHLVPYTVEVFSVYHSPVGHQSLKRFHPYVCSTFCSNGNLLSLLTSFIAQSVSLLRPLLPSLYTYVSCPLPFSDFGCSCIIYLCSIC